MMVESAMVVVLVNTIAAWIPHQVRDDKKEDSISLLSRDISTITNFDVKSFHKFNSASMQISNYEEAINYIFSLTSPREESKNKKVKVEFNIERIRDFLDKVGNPQFSYPVIHVGGTSGKGSTVYLISNILMNLGFKTGIHMSPNLVKLNEKFRIGEKNLISDISDTDLVKLVNWFAGVQEKTRFDDLSFYEAIIAMVFKHFENEKVDVAVIEVAMGGRLDATNVVNSDVAVLNSVGFDHMEFLGNTLKKIAWDKMHIMKPGKPFVCGIEISDIVEMIKAHADKLGSSTKFLNSDFSYKIKSSNLNGSVFDFANEEVKFNDLNLNLVGEFQVHNASLAVEAVYEFLKSKDENLILNFEKSVREAFANAKFRGRFDIVQNDPLIILDGAHNEAKMQNFCDSLTKYVVDKDVELLFACKGTKEIDSILKQIQKLNLKKIYLCEFKRQYYTEIISYKVEELEEKFRRNFGDSIEIVKIKNPWEAFCEFKNNLPKDRVGVVTGSLYLLGEIYKYI